MWRKIFNLQEYFICGNENFKVIQLFDKHVSNLAWCYNTIEVLGIQVQLVSFSFVIRLGKNN
jgi:hypothetical protein